MANQRISEESVAESLRIVLIKKNLNIAKLSEMLGVTSTTMYSKFKRDNFTVKDLQKISDALGISCDIGFTILDNNQ